MKQYTTVKNQSIIGLAVQLYGNVDAIVELMELNDLQDKIHQPGSLTGEIDLGFSLKPGMEIQYDETSKLYNKATITDLNGRIITDGWIKRRVYSKQYSIQYA